MTDFWTAHDDFLSHLSGLNRSRHTIDAYGHDVQQFVDFLASHGVTSLSEITPDHVSAWIAPRPWACPRPQPSNTNPAC